MYKLSHFQSHTCISPAFNKTVSAVKSYLHKLDDDDQTETDRQHSCMNDDVEPLGSSVTWPLTCHCPTCPHNRVCPIGNQRSGYRKRVTVQGTLNAACIWTDKFPTFIWSFFHLLLARLLLAALTHEMVYDRDREIHGRWMLQWSCGAHLHLQVEMFGHSNHC